MAVLTFEQILSGSSLGLVSGLSDLLMLEIGGRRVLFALSRTENRLIEIEVSGTGALQVAGSLNLQGTFPAGSEPLLGHVTMADGDTMLTLAGLSVADGQSVTLSETGTLGSQQTLPGVGVLTAPVGLILAGTSAMVSKGANGGLNLYTDTGSGLVWTAGINNNADRFLSDVAASVAFSDSGVDYVATVSSGEDGLNIVAATAGSLLQTGAIGASNGLPIDLPSDIDLVHRLDETLLVVASAGTSSVSVVRVSGGVPVLADHVLDGEDTQFRGASSISALTYGEFAFIGVGGAEGGVSLLTALPGGRLIHLDSFADSDATSLYRLSSVELAVAGSVLQIYGTSFWEAGVTRLSFDLTPLGSVVLADGTGTAAIGTIGDDQVIGSDVSEALSGGAGDDILLDGAGSDVLTGGPGADLFAMSADGQTDTITDFERGIDRLDLSAFDFLYDVDQLVIAPTGDGAILSHGFETITIVTLDGLPLTAAELRNADILNIDRPSFLEIGQDLVGGAGPDTLNGGMGPDTIQGAAGDDSLSGGFGDDVLVGGAGFDTLDGGGGNDTLHGQSEDDTLIGGTGDDLIYGDGGDDVIYGDDWPGA